jgi:hypothetical protein
MHNVLYVLSKLAEGDGDARNLLEPAKETLDQLQRSTASRRDRAESLEGLGRESAPGQGKSERHLPGRQLLGQLAPENQEEVYVLRTFPPYSVSASVAWH